MGYTPSPYDFFYLYWLPGLFRTREHDKKKYFSKYTFLFFTLFSFHLNSMQSQFEQYKWKFNYSEPSILLAHFTPRVEWICLNVFERTVEWNLPRNSKGIIKTNSIFILNKIFVQVKNVMILKKCIWIICCCKPIYFACNFTNNIVLYFCFCLRQV